MFVDNVLERLAFAKPLEIIHKKVNGHFAQVLGAIGGVRRDQEIVEVPEGMVGRQGFFVEYVESGSANLCLLYTSPSPRDCS